jgi:DNA polymerase III epsilon subunit-like protein
MKYVVIDIETTGLDHHNNDVLSIGAVVEDTTKKLRFEEIPRFHCAILHKELKGSPFAIRMNNDLIGAIAEYQSTRTDAQRAELVQLHRMQFYTKDEVAEKFFYWLLDAGIVQDWNFETDGREYLDRHVKVIDGKTYPMISQKMKKAYFNVAGKNYATFDKRFLEELPNWTTCMKTSSRVIDPAILYVDWLKDDALPDLSTCKVRAGLDKTVSHNALEDAWDTLQTLRKFY